MTEYKRLCDICGGFNTTTNPKYCSYHSSHKAQVVYLVGRRLDNYMNHGPVPFKFCFFTLNQWNPDPLGIKNLHKVPPAWFEDVVVPGFIVERVGKYGIRIQ